MHNLNDVFVVGYKQGLIEKLRESNLFSQRHGEWLVVTFDVAIPHGAGSDFEVGMINHVLEFENVLKQVNTNNYVMLCTDYWGGVGDQSAKFVDMTDSTKNERFFGSYGAINDALKLLGVIKPDDCDLFDVVGLGSYRSNEAIIPEEILKEREQKAYEEKIAKEIEEYRSWKKEFEAMTHIQQLDKINKLITDSNDSFGFLGRNSSYTKEQEELREFNKHLTTYLQTDE